MYMVVVEDIHLRYTSKPISTSGIVHNQARLKRYMGPVHNQKI